MTEDQIEISIREFNANDLNFIMSKWLKNYKFSSRFTKKIKPDVYYKWHHLLIENIMGRITSTILIANPTDEPGVNLGFICFETMDNTKVIHYIFVKPEFRNFGIGKRLYHQAMGDKSIGYFTHWTYPIDTLEMKIPNLTYDPYRI
jgi:GNAT superfamily N-acetyltransferase